jgi:hypothetical protein
VADASLSLAYPVPITRCLACGFLLADPPNLDLDQQACRHHDEHADD